MINSNLSLWRAFQKLANEYPDCNAVKLTLEMQRWFISVQQHQFLVCIAALVQPVGESIPV